MTGGIAMTDEFRPLTELGRRSGLTDSALRMRMRRDQLGIPVYRSGRRLLVRAMDIERFLSGIQPVTIEHRD
jgi:hypothetical protein